MNNFGRQLILPSLITAASLFILANIFFLVDELSSKQKVGYATVMSKSIIPGHKSREVEYDMWGPYYSKAVEHPMKYQICIKVLKDTECVTVDETLYTNFQERDSVKILFYQTKFTGRVTYIEILGW